MARFPSPVNHGLRCLNMRMLALAVCITLFHALLPAQCTTLTIATSYNVAMDPSTYVSSLYISGLMAPLRAASGNGVSYIASTSSLSNTMAPKTNSLVQSMASEGAVAVFGFAGTFMFAYIMHWKFNNPQKIPIFGPFAETADLASGGYYITGPYAEYKPWILWTIPLDGAQSLALLYYLASRPFFPVNQVALIQNSETSGPVCYGVGRTAGLLFALEMPRCGVTQYNTANTVNAYSSILQSKPGIVYMFGQLMGGQGYVTGGENTVTAAWIQRAVSDIRLVAANSTVVTTFYIQYAMLQEYQRQRSSGKKMLPPENIISSAPTPGVDAAEYSVTQNFHTEVTSFSGCGNNACKNYVLAGWVSATALTHAISMYGGTSAITCKSLFSNLQPAQSSFLVSDLFIGSFGPDSTTCSAVAQSQGAVCHCNQAGMNVFFTRFGIVGSQVDVVTIPGAVFQYAKGKCASVIPPGDTIPVIMPYTDLVTFSVAKRLVGLSPTDNAMMSDMCNAVSAVSTVLSNRVLYRHLAPNGYTVGCISTTLATASSAVTSHMSSYVTTAMSGVMPDAMVDSIPTPSTFVLDFMPQTTQPQVMRSNLVYLFPTLDQELYVLASYLHDVVTASSVVCGVVSKSSVSPSIVTLLSRSLMTYGMTVASGHFVQTSSALASSIPSACTHTFLVGVGDGDASGVASYLKSHTSAVVLLSFDDVTKYYSSLRTFVGGLSSSMTDRLVFATNVPSWTATPSNPTAASASAPLSTVTQFLQSVPDSLHTPAAVRAFIVAMMYDLLMSGSHDTDPNVQKLLYAAVTVHLDGMVFGPFSAECTSMEAPMSGGCVGNVGATAIAVWSYTRVVKPATPLLVPLAVPSMAHQYASGVPAAAVGEDMDDVNASSDTSMQAACVSWSDSSVVEVSSSSSSNTTTTTSPPVSLRPQSSSGETTSHTRFSISINDVLIFFYAAVVVVLVVIVVLLLWKYNVVHRVWECPRHMCAFFGGCWEPRLPSDDGQRQRSMDASRWVASSVVSRTIVVVEVDHWRPLWVHVPEVMRHVVEDYRRCVRGAVLRHGCVEVCAVGGVFVLVCPSAFSSVQLVKDIHAGLNAMSSALKAALVSAYLSFRAVGDGAEPQTLCVRVGVDTNGVGSDPIGPFMCSDGSVEVATRAAYRSGPWHSGLCVMTERTRSALTEEELTSVHLCLPSAGLHSLHCGSENVVLELFVLASDACAETTLSTSISSERRCDFALEMLSSGTETSVESVSTSLCLTTLRAFYHGLPSQRVEGLVKMHQWLGLPAVSLSAYADESGYVDALLACVCQRVAALLECRHGFLPGELRHRSVRGVSCVRMREEEGLSDNDANHARSNGKRSKRGRRRFSVHNSTRNVLRRFAYESGVAEL